MEIRIDQDKENNDPSYSEDYLSCKQTFFESEKHETHELGHAKNQTIPLKDDLTKSPLSSKERLTSKHELRYYSKITIVSFD